jgi:membrane protein YqaA with SNARE-associated domain
VVIADLLNIIETPVKTARGPLGVIIIFIYSFLIAFALPGVSEVVLAAPLDLGLGYLGRMTTIILISSIGKSIGSFLAFYIGQEAKQAGPIIRALRRSPVDVIEWSERQAVDLAQRYGYLGLAVGLMVPGFPDTISIYAFSVLEDDYPRFFLATFVGSVGRLLVVLGGIEVIVTLISVVWT